MNTMHLRYAVEIERTGSISQAATNLYMGQPNLSKAIKELEASLGIVIFQRNSRGVTPTPMGREFLAKARAILAQLDEMEALCKTPNDASAFRLTAPPASYIAYAFTRFLRRLSRREPLVVDFREQDSAGVFAAVKDGFSFLGVVRLSLSDRGYMERLLEESNLRAEAGWEFQPLLLFSVRHPLADAACVRGEDLEPYTVLHNHEVVRDRGRNAAGKGAGFSLSIYDRHSQLHLLRNITTAYTWTSPLPAALLNDFGLMQRPCLDSPEPCLDLVICRKSYSLCQLDYQFLDELTAIRREIMDQLEEADRINAG